MLGLKLLFINVKRQWRRQWERQTVPYVWQAEDAEAAAGLDFSPASIDEFAARIRALSVPRSPSLLLGGGGDFVAKETPATLLVVRHRYVIGGAPSSVDMSDLVDITDSFAPLCAFALMGGPRHGAVRCCEPASGHSLPPSPLPGQASPRMAGEHGSAVGGLICETPPPPRLYSL